MLDPNLKTDLSWLNRLTAQEERTRELVEDLLSRGVMDYEKDILARYPEYNITKAVIYVVGNKGFKYFPVE
jgi:hypothetical protein